MSYITHAGTTDAREHHLAERSDINKTGGVLASSRSRAGQYKYVDGPLVPTLGLDLFECSMWMGNKSERPNAGSMASMLGGWRHSPEVPGSWLI